jgi:thioredoxin reductase (NADPH)
MEKYDIIIVGAGPAGLTAGIYSGRQGSKTLLVDKGICGGLGLEVPSMENYPGFDLIAGMTLVAKMKKQASKYVDIHENEEVKNVEKCENGFEVETTKNKYHSKAIILSMGSKHKKLEVSGEKEFLGRGISYCATCDGLLYKDKKVIIVGGGNSALQEAIFLNNIGANVTIVHRRDELRGEEYLQEKVKSKGIAIIFDSQVKEIRGNSFVESVILLNKEGNEKEIVTDGVFISIGYNPTNKIAIDLDVKLNNGKEIITDKNQRTNVPYIYSAGDITGGLKQWVVACGEGAIAANSAYKDIENIK